MKNQKSIQGPVVEAPVQTPYIKAFLFSIAAAVFMIVIAMFIAWLTGSNKAGIMYLIMAATIVVMAASWFWFTYGCASQQQIETKLRKTAIRVVQEESDAAVQRMQAGCEVAIGLLTEQTEAAILQIRGEHRDQIVEVKRNLATAICTATRLELVLQYAGRFLSPVQQLELAAYRERLQKNAPLSVELHMARERIAENRPSGDLARLQTAVGQSVQHHTPEPAKQGLKLVKR